MTSNTLTTTDLEITLDERDGATLLRLRGRLGIGSSPGFRDQLLATLREQLTRPILIDMAEVTYIDASGIATLIEGLKIARNRRESLCLTGLQGRVLHLFEVTGLLNLFETSVCKAASSAARVR